MHSRPLAAVIYLVLAWSPGMVLGVLAWLVAGSPGPADTAFTWGWVAAVPTCVIGAVVGWQRAARRSAAAGEPT